jgi:NAD(P)-dependent dehydrogenase (short-subunit alcohol dehydrogenase family)
LLIEGIVVVTDTAFTSWLSPEQVEWATQRHPFRGLGAPEDIANAAAFLVSEENTWITGTGLAVDGGYSSM